MREGQRQSGAGQLSLTLLLQLVAPLLPGQAEAAPGSERHRQLAGWQPATLDLLLLRGTPTLHRQRKRGGHSWDGAEAHAWRPDVPHQEDLQVEAMRFASWSQNRGKQRSLVRWHLEDQRSGFATYTAAGLAGAS
ncbi:hypothetical protein V8C86DRAFT_2753577 [Haematococcus lacustris]